MARSPDTARLAAMQFDLEPAAPHDALA